MTTNKSQYLTGQTVSLNTTSSLGSRSYLYKYVIDLNGTILSTIDYTNSSNLQYKFDNSGTYTITEYMKDALSTKAYDDMKNISIKVYSQPQATLIASQATVVTGTAVNFTQSEIDGSGTAQYRFVVMKNNNIISDSGYSDSKAFSFAPIDSGTYTITGYMKDTLSENTNDCQNSTNLTVYSPQLSSVTASGSFYIGKALSFNSLSSGVSPLGFSYKYEIYNNNALLTSNNFNSLSTFSFTPVNSGIYTIKVYGKDLLSTKTYDSIKQFNITITNKPLSLTILPLYLGMTNNDVVSLQNSLIKLGYTIASPNGYFGADTKSAAIAFQKSKGLTQDGIVGNMTYGALNDALIEKAGTKNLTF